MVEPGCCTTKRSVRMQRRPSLPTGQRSIRNCIVFTQPGRPHALTSVHKQRKVNYPGAPTTATQSAVLGTGVSVHRAIRRVASHISAHCALVSTAAWSALVIWERRREMARVHRTTSVEHRLPMRSLTSQSRNVVNRLKYSLAVSLIS